VPNENGRSLAGVLAETRDELKEFVQTRLEMLKSELQDKVKAYKAAVPSAAIGITLLLTAWLVLTGALVAVIAAAFYPSRWAYFFALLIVGFVYLLAGGVLALVAYKTVRDTGVAPERTLKVLKDDRVWLQTEARQQV
jgi:VIT1/CCC1 family predicted Fe2+/Mn2+ transporter